MSVIIPDMEIPETCVDCRLNYDGYCCAYADFPEDIPSGKESIERAEFCPLVTL